jgi:hypothetical protein
MRAALFEPTPGARRSCSGRCLGAPGDHAVRPHNGRSTPKTRRCGARWSNWRRAPDAVLPRHLEFPEIFDVPERRCPRHPDRLAWRFGCVVGKPPWEQIELKEQEYSRQGAPEIAGASGAKRKRKNEDLTEADDSLHFAYVQAKRDLDVVRHLDADSDRYPLTARGRVKTDPLFAIDVPRTRVTNWSVKHPGTNWNCHRRYHAVFL